MKEMSKILQLDKTHRIIQDKKWSGRCWGWFVYFQQKVFLLGWMNQSCANHGWDLEYGFTEKEAEEEAQKLQALYLEL